MIEKATRFQCPQSESQEKSSAAKTDSSNQSRCRLQPVSQACAQAQTIARCAQHNYVWRAENDAMPRYYAALRSSAGNRGEINPGNPPALAGEYIAQAPCRVSKARNPAIRQMREPFQNTDRTRGAEPPEHQAESTQLNKNLFTILSARP